MKLKYRERKSYGWSQIRFMLDLSPAGLKESLNCMKMQQLIFIFRKKYTYDYTPNKLF